MKKGTFIWFIMICIPLILLTYDVLGKKESNKYLESEKREHTSKDTKNQLLSRHNTLELPSDILNKKQYYTYTYGLQTYLMHQNKEPILFKGFLQDITKEGNNFIAHFRLHEKRHRQGLNFHLKCKDEYVNSILEHYLEERAKHDREEYWVVCRVTEVNKISTDNEHLYSIKGEVIEMLKI
ncbi:MAG TPA: hypothetical protein PLT30_08275 [Deltaproteobacteria bacterium]|jgi:hypothetical protein|nr:hypothetical protein [Deltaproteobacteria bacterium]